MAALIRMVKMGIAFSLLALLLILALPSLTPVRGPQIAFESYQGGTSEIYLLDTTTNILLNLTHNERNDARPVWSPDGRRIAFASNRTDNYEIYVMDADGSNVRNLTRHASDDFAPTWSPDGMQLAFVSRREGNSEIYVMNVADILSDPVCAALPDVVFQNSSQPCAPPVRRLTNSVVDEVSPAWSPDGPQIAFVQETDQDSEIYLMNVACNLPQGCPSDRYNLSDDPARDRDPAWSPNGRQIAFASNRGGTFDIYMMNADGSQIRALTDGMGTYVNPSWSPDGQQIVFAGRHGAGWALYALEVEAGNTRRLTYNGDEDFRPAWRP